MIGITFIGSGSKGNSALLELAGRFYLLDAGLSCKRIKEHLDTINLDFSDLSGIFVTHEHDDHVKGLRVVLGKCSEEIPVYCTRGTMCALDARGYMIKNHVEIVYGRTVDLGTSDVTPFKVPHDATEPAGLRFAGSGKVMALATDLGHVTTEVIDYMQDADLVCVESNYDEDMLRTSSYPAWLKRRIRSPMGHLPNEGVRGILSRMKKVPEVLVMMHISQESNTPELAMDALELFLENSGSRFRSTRVCTVSQDESSARMMVGEVLSASLKHNLLGLADASNFLMQRKAG